MAELNLDRIKLELDKKFSSNLRKLVFWYDHNAEFKEDILCLQLDNAEIYLLEHDNQFKTKYILEIEKADTNFLVYAPFPKPSTIDNHLADTVFYADEFSADKSTIIAVDLCVGMENRKVIEKYIKFFGSKERIQKFEKLALENINQEKIELAILSIICKLKVPSFDDVTKNIIADYFTNNKILAEFSKYNILNVFWEMCEIKFGYITDEPTIEKLMYTLFTTYISKEITCNTPHSLDPFCSVKHENIIAFIENLFDSSSYSDTFDLIVDKVYQDLSLKDVFTNLNLEDYCNIKIFPQIEELIIKWIIDKLNHYDTSAKLNSIEITKICKERIKSRYGAKYYNDYYALKNAFYLIKEKDFTPKSNIQEICDYYVTNDYIFDQKYRYFYYHLDKIENTDLYTDLIELADNIYTNNFLNPLSIAWTTALAKNFNDINLTKQQDFYKKFISQKKERIVVIISDAMRYEVGQSLLKKLQTDEKCTAEITPIQGVIPSYTQLGMSALLPHNTLEMNDKFDVLVDDKVCNDLKSRTNLIQSHIKNSIVVRFDDIKNQSNTIIKEQVANKDLIYIYHDEIDAHGDKAVTENETFETCESAVNEIFNLIKKLTSANNTRFIITADHGFIYKRNKITEIDKIGNFDKDNILLKRRYIIADKPVLVEGVTSISLGDVLKNDDKRKISLPISSNIFKASGSGINFVHGGASLQEMIVPVITVKTNKSSVKTSKAEIKLVSTLDKITNLTTYISFVQSELVSSTTKEAKYSIYFVTDKNEKITNVVSHIADKKELDENQNTFKEKFVFKNQKYEKTDKFYLIIANEVTEIYKKQVILDFALVDDYGFDI